MLELSQLATRVGYTVKSVCFSPLGTAEADSVRCTVSLRAKGVNYVCFGEGETMERAMRVALGNLENNNVRVSHHQ